MTSEQAKELLPFVQAYANGKEIQARWKDDANDTWEDLKNIEGFRADVEYRIKPEPRRFWAIISESGSVGAPNEDKSFIESLCGRDERLNGCRVIELREVL